MRTLLLNPGPVTLSERVRGALNGPDLCHRESEFAELQARLRKKLLAVYACNGAEWASILLTGSGTAAVEAMLISCVPRGGRLLIVENGVYGERMSRIAEAYDIDHGRVSSAWGEAIDIGALNSALSRGAYTHVAVVHHETTTGRLNDVGALADACTRHGARLLIDGVSSFGAERVDFDDWPIDAIAATANKCLHGVPGTAFVVVRRSAIDGGPEPVRSVYLNLADYLAKQDADGTPFTQSIQTFYALDAALDEFFEAGGWRARRRLFRERMAVARETLERLGVRALLDREATSCVLNSFELPPGRTYEELHAGLKSRGIIIYAGQGALSERVFRISMMGDIREQDLVRLCAAFEDVLVSAQ